MTRAAGRTAPLLAGLVVAAAGCPMILGVDDLETVDPQGAGAASSASGVGAAGAAASGPGGAGASGGTSSGSTSGSGGSGGDCQKDCLGGTCSGTSCNPVQLVAEQAPVHGVAVANDGTVYWTTDTGTGHVRTCDVDNCTGTQKTLWQDQTGATGIAVVVPWLYWVVPGEFHLCDVTTGCGSYNNETTTVDSGVTVDAALEHVYWTSAATDEILTCSHNFCSPEPFESSSQGPGGVTVAPPYLYWTSWTGSAGSIQRCKVPDCTELATLVSGSTQLGGVAVDAEGLYWTDRDANSVWRCDLSDCDGSRTKIAGDQHTPNGIAVDDISVYWASEGNMAVYRLAK